MSEDPPIYLTLEQELNALDLREAVTNDPSASHWLKRAVAELWERDVVDALNALNALNAWMYCGKCWKRSTTPIYSRCNGW